MSLSLDVDAEAQRLSDLPSGARWTRPPRLWRQQGGQEAEAWARKGPGTGRGGGFRRWPEKGPGPGGGGAVGAPNTARTFSKRQRELAATGPRRDSWGSMQSPVVSWPGPRACTGGRAVGKGVRGRRGLPRPV